MRMVGFFLVVIVRLKYLLLGSFRFDNIFGQWVFDPIDPGTFWSMSHWSHRSRDPAYYIVILSDFQKYKVQMGVIWLKYLLQKWFEPIVFSAWLDAKKWYIACLYNINPSGARTFKSRFSCLYLLLVRNTKDDAHIFLDL